jgi:uncharacterized protein with ATP-grasp and redox domains
MCTTDEKSKQCSTGIASVCYTCVLNQTYSTARFAGLDEEQTKMIIAVARAEMEKAKTKPILVQHVVRRVADAVIQVKEEGRNFDIYADVKEKSNTLSMTYAERFQKKIDSGEVPLEVGLQIAAAGNIIDFGAKSHGSFNLNRELDSLGSISFTRYDIQPFKKKLAEASTLLYICDNSGEIVFDMLLIKELKKEYPELRIVAALRDKPIINDATLEDAEAVGLDRLITVISSGSVYPGTILSETTEHFRDLFDSADVILSKGQGNFETLLPVADNRLFFLFRVKCEYMAALSKAEVGDLVLLQG